MPRRADSEVAPGSGASYDATRSWRWCRWPGRSRNGREDRPSRFSRRHSGSTRRRTTERGSRETLRSRGPPPATSSGTCSSGTHGRGTWWSTPAPGAEPRWMSPATWDAGPLATTWLPPAETSSGPMPESSRSRTAKPDSSLWILPTRPTSSTPTIPAASADSMPPHRPTSRRWNRSSARSSGCSAPAATWPSTSAIPTSTERGSSPSESSCSRCSGNGWSRSTWSASCATTGRWSRPTIGRPRSTATTSCGGSTTCS